MRERVANCLSHRVTSDCAAAYWPAAAAASVRCTALTVYSAVCVCVFPH